MSEGLFVDELQLFGTSHPTAEGWMVYQFSDDTANKHSFRYLLDFLRDRHPESVKYRRTVQQLAPYELDQRSPYHHVALPESAWDRQKELDGELWFGEIHLEWQGQPVRMCRALLHTGPGYACVFHVATQSNRTLRAFIEEVDVYGRDRAELHRTKQIFVVNGEDIPLVSVAWEDIALPEGMGESIRANVAAFFKSGHAYAELNVPYRRGMLFVGPPGCGKTLMVKALAYHSGVKVISVLGKASVGDHEIETALDLANRQSPAIVIFEDLDKLIQGKDVSLSHFLNILDGFAIYNGILVLATANQPELLDPALLHRPSRFDRVWTFPLPSFEQRFSLLRRKGGGYYSEEVLREVAEQSQGFSMAYVQEILVNALLTCVHAGRGPQDSDLLNSICVLKGQRKAASKSMPAVIDEERVGFEVG